MAVKLENLGKNKVKVTFDVSAHRLEEGIQHAYNKNKSKINIPGFRKGKAPRKLIEMSFGKEVFFDDAVNHILPEAYDAAINELNLNVVSKPEIDVDSISTEEGVVISAEIYIRPEVTLTEYKGVTYKKEDVTVTDEEVNAEIDKVREKNARLISIEDRAAQLNDTVVIDFAGYIDDVAFEGGTAEDYELVLGTHTFIDTFEDQLVGQNIGDEVVVNVTFPEDYGQESLAGKPAKFEVKIKEIKYKEMPELDDEFAQDVSEFDKLEDYQKDIRTKLEHDKAHEAEHKEEEEILKAIIAKAEMDLPQPMVENQINSMMRDFSQRLQMQGMNLESFLGYTGMDSQMLRQSYQEKAEFQVKARLCLEEVAKAENIEITDDEVMEEVQRIADSYKMEKEKLLEVMQDEEKENLKIDLKVQKALKLVVGAAVADSSTTEVAAE